MALESAQIEAAEQTITQIRDAIATTIIGQNEIIQQVILALMANGHVLIEGVPGLAKTLLVRSLAKAVDGEFSRIQFTPDLMPGDITGHVMYDMNQQSFRIRKGPVFTNFLLADEINRAPAKTQAALLEVMQEKQITIEGKTYETGQPFLVLATQNPVEQDGTYPLPEAELDRFMFKVYIDYPGENEEIEITERIAAEIPNNRAGLEAVPRCISLQRLRELQQLTRQVAVDKAVLNYTVNIVRKTRHWSGIFRGAGPRASIYLLLAAKALSLMAGRSFVTPDDIKQAVKPVLRHRILLTAEREIEGVNSDSVLDDLLAQTTAPRQ